MKQCTIRKDLQQQGLSVPILKHGNVEYISGDRVFPYGVVSEDGDFTIVVDGVQCIADSIDFDFIN